MRDSPTGFGAESESGQAFPGVVGGSLAMVGFAVVLTAIGGATTGASRVQRAADLSAVSAARSMRDGLPDLVAGTGPWEARLSRFEAVARSAALQAGRRNGVGDRRLRVRFGPGRPPLRVTVSLRAEVGPTAAPGGERLDGRSPDSIPVLARATAEAIPAYGGWTGMPPMASGGGYSGPLVYRNGEGMRPDVAAAFDRMAAAARRAGHGLIVSSGFRSDREQAILFARHPDPRWVAPPGRSLHRCATELDLGPASAYGWLAAKARRFGFVKRYAWEPWHYGFVAGPAPCSAMAERGDGASTFRTLPGFVPRRFRGAIVAAGARWGVSPALLAAQLMAESGFDPNAVSSAGALGIAQFMPGTARAVGLRDPFNPFASIRAQARLMSSHLRAFRSVPLALAAYNAGPGAVAGCRCVPPYPETRAYVARILALLDGSGLTLGPRLEVRLVR